MFEKLVASIDNYYKLVVASVISDDLIIDLSFVLHNLHIRARRDEIATWAENNFSSLKKLLTDNYILKTDNYYRFVNDNNPNECICLCTEDTYKSIIDNIIDNYTEIKEISYLKGYKNIPDLKLVVFSVDDDDYYELERKKQFKEKQRSIIMDNVVDHKLLEIFKVLTEYATKNNLYTSKENLIKEFNNLSFDKILPWLDSYPKFLGKGADGFAFDIGDNKVLKIFTSDLQYQKSNESLNMLFSKHDLARTELMIYDVGSIGDAFDKHYYYQIMPKLNTKFYKDKNISNAFETLLDRIISHCENDVYLEKLQLLYDNSNYDELNKLVKTLTQPMIKYMYMNAKHIISKIENYAESINQHLSSNWLEHLVEEIWLKLASRRTDLHSGNIGITPNGYFRFFDPVFY